MKYGEKSANVTNVTLLFTLRPRSTVEGTHDGRFAQCSSSQARNQSFVGKTLKQARQALAWRYGGRIVPWYCMRMHNSGVYRVVVRWPLDIARRHHYWGVLSGGQFVAEIAWQC